jgi:hypothetical protein
MTPPLHFFFTFFSLLRFYVFFFYAQLETELLGMPSDESLSDRSHNDNSRRSSYNEGALEVNEIAAPVFVESTFVSQPIPIPTTGHAAAQENNLGDQELSGFCCYYYIILFMIAF